MSLITHARASAILGSFVDRRPLIVGDVMLDEFLFGDVRRISAEAPVPVVHLRRESHRLGASGNVAANAAALGARPSLVASIGDDSAGQGIREQLASHGIADRHLVVTAGRPTTRKTRIIAQGQQIVRCDREDSRDLAQEHQDQLLAACVELLPRADVVIVPDYAKGCLTERVIAGLLAAAAARGIPVLVDPTARRLQRYQPITVLTPNHHEAAAAADLEDSGEDEEVVLAGTRILARIRTQFLLITRGEAGMTLFERGDSTDDPGRVTHIPTVAREVFDVTGAGDTVSTTFALALASAATPVEAAVLANHAAGIVVGKVGTATATVGEILASIPAR